MVVKLATIAIVLAVGVAAVLYPTRDADACTFPRGPNPHPAAIGRADIAFIGRSIAERPLAGGASWQHESTVVVESVIKGNIGGEVVLSPLPFSSGDCRRGPQLPVGTTALVLMDSSYGPGRPFGLDVYPLDSMTIENDFDGETEATSVETVPQDAGLPNSALALMVTVAAATLVGCLAQVRMARERN